MPSHIYFPLKIFISSKTGLQLDQGCFAWNCFLEITMQYNLALIFLFLGRIALDILGLTNISSSTYDWIDPGAMSLLGAVSFFGGVSRLTMSLTVIMVEMTNDIQFLLLIMTCVMVAKMVGDCYTHPFYHALLEIKCIPFLDQASKKTYLKKNKKKTGLTNGARACPKC